MPKPRVPPIAPSKDPSDYAAFRGNISRAVWRVFAQYLTPTGRWFAAITAIFAFYGGYSLRLQGYVIATYAGAVWWIALCAMVLFRPRAKLSAAMASRCGAGETLPVDLEIHQLGRLRGADLSIVPHNLPPAIDSVPLEGVVMRDLRHGESSHTRLGLKCNRRGAFALHGFRVETSFPFGILRSRRTILEEHKLLVYPTFTPLTHLQLASGRRYQPGGVALTSRLGESFEYLGNREYRDGDNVRDIDWRATARIQRPIVREWVEEYMMRVAVVLDTHVPENGPVKVVEKRADAFERAVSIAAAVSDFMARQDYLVDIFAAGPNLYHLTAGRSLAYLDQILDILACVEANPKESFDLMEPQIAELISRISTVICVMLDWDESRQGFVRRMYEQGTAVKVIVVRDEPCTLDPSADAGAIGEVVVVTREAFDLGIGEL